MAGRCIGTGIIFFGDHCHRGHWITACLVVSFGLGSSGYLPFLPVGQAVSCYCGNDCDVFDKLCLKRGV